MTPWLLRQKSDPNACLRLYCFPSAGMGASMYRTWAPEMPVGVEMYGVQPPGREGRLRDPAFTRMADLVDAATDALWSGLDRPFALFGHSLGALVAFEVARRLWRRGGPQPWHVIASGRRAPHLALRHPPMAHLDDTAFVAEVRRRYDGIPEEVLQHPDLMALLLPTLRADITAFEGYAYEPGEPLGCPITAYGGDDDFEARCDEVTAWRQHTRAGFRHRIFPGKHFFVQSARALVLRDLGETLAPLVQAAGPAAGRRQVPVGTADVPTKAQT